MKDIFDLIIIGGGPGGVAAGVYAARKKLKTLFITDAWGGQSTVSDDIQNWIGTPHISGAQLAKNLKEHLEEYAANDVTILTPARATGVVKSGELFEVSTGKGTFTTRTVLLTVGSARRKLDVPGADIFEHKGLTYCASCDGPLFTDADVVVVGGGNAAFESAAQLLAYAKSVTLIDRGPEFRADPVTVEKVTANKHMTALHNTISKEVHGDVFVSGLSVIDAITKEERLIPCTGIFIEIGLLPNTDFLGTIVDLSPTKQVLIDPWTQKTSVPGIWAAGDCTNVKYHQNNIAAGDAVRALEDIYAYLKA